MAERYFRVDVSFFHKRTCQTLMRKLGPGGPLTFLALVARAKDGSTPGVFTYASEAIAWEKLGLDPNDVGFTLDQFLDATGRLKQTSRTRVGRLTNVKLTRYELWQKDSERYEGAVRKSRSRQQNTRDMAVTPLGTRPGQERYLGSRTSSTPKPPLNGTQNCPECGVTIKPPTTMADHLWQTHDIQLTGAST